jgi:hypothetical protein
VLKWILLLVGVGLIYFWIKNKGRAAQVKKEKSQTPPASHRRVRRDQALSPLWSAFAQL